MKKITTEQFYNGRVTLHGGDCREVVKTLPDNSVDSLVSDTPYALASISKRFSNSPRSEATENTENPYGRTGRGFMGQKWDTGDVAHDPEFWRECFRVLKPGAYVAVFGGTRTSHKLAMALELAGFEIRDTIINVIDPESPVVAFMESLDEAQLGAFLRCLDDSQFGGLLAWVFGTGFPKSHDLSKGIDGHLFGEWLDSDPVRRAEYRAEIRAAGDDREAKGDVEQRWRELGGFARTVISERATGWEGTLAAKGALHGLGDAPDVRRTTAAATGEAFQWDGFGTALKPAFEPIILARKPLSEETIAANVLRWRTGGLNIDGCRVPTDEIAAIGSPSWGGPMKRLSATPGQEGKLVPRTPPDNAGRWPANLVTDGSDAVAGMFPDTKSGQLLPHHAKTGGSNIGTFEIRDRTGDAGTFGGDSGSAARFFYSSKASAADRAGSKHPTVKPVSLKQWLVRLVTPPGGITLDPFAGTGTTGEAAVREGVRCIMVEREKKYLADVRRRMGLIFSGPEECNRAEIKPKSAASLPLFVAAKGHGNGKEARPVPVVQTDDGQVHTEPAGATIAAASDVGSLPDSEIVERVAGGEMLPAVQPHQRQHAGGGVGGVSGSVSGLLAKLRSGLRPVVHPRIEPGDFADGQ